MTASQRLQNANTTSQRKARQALQSSGGLTLTGASPLSKEEKQQLEACEEVIERGFRTWYEVGEALLHIRDNRLYRAEHRTFEDYCRERWSMSKTNANRLIAGSEVISNLTPMGVILDNERQARELTPFAPDEQRLIVEVAKEVFGDKPVTASDIKSLGTVLREIKDTKAIDNGDGKSIPVASSSIIHLKAAVTEETYERMKRQEMHIAESRERRLSPQARATDEFEWYTPPRYLDAARAVLGQIDLDPASSFAANTTVRAACIYTLDDDGLTQPWEGRVWLNPPYGTSGPAFVARLIEAFNAGDVTEAITLVNANSCDAKWFQPLWDHTLCFTHHRIDFISPHGEKASSSTHGSVFVYLGSRQSVFAEHFRPFGAVVARVG